MGWLEGKVAVVTGVAAGIGQECARIFAAEGASIVGADLDATAAEATVAEIRAVGGTIEGVHPCDLTQPTDVQRLIDTAAALHGRIDILVNAAAHCHFGAASEMDYERQWRPTIAAEVDSVFLVVRAAWPHLIASGSASIINFASVVARRAAPEMIAHAAGKGAILAMTRQFAFEGGPHNIRANSISPGLVNSAATRMRAAARGAGRNPKLDGMMIKRVGQPEDIAWACVYLASDRASWVTGADLPVDGGTTAG